MKNFLITIILVATYNTAAFAQTITGGVFNEDLSPVSFANIVLMSADSIFIDGTITDQNGLFLVEKNENAKYIIVSCLGYETKTLSINTNLTKIILKNANLELDEVSIVAERKKIQIKGDALVTNVSGSPIAKLSDIKHI